MLRLSAPFRSAFYLLSFYFRRVIFQRFPVPCFVSCTSPFALHFSVLCRLAPCLCTLPFVLCLPCVIGRRRILQHFVSCASPFDALSFCALSLNRSVLCRTQVACRSSSSVAALLSKAHLADSPLTNYVSFFCLALTRFPALSVVLPDALAPVPVKGRFLPEREYGLSDRFVIQRNARAVTVVANRPVSIDAEAACRRYRIHICAEKEELPAVLFLLSFNEPPELPIAVTTARIFLPVRSDHEEGVRRAFFRARLAVQISDVPNRTAIASSSAVLPPTR